MAKILITSIGTEECLKDGIGKCQKTIYQIDGKRYENKVLLIDALTEHHQFDKIFFIGICKSVWDSIYTLWANDDCDELLKQRESTQGVQSDTLDIIEKVVDAKLQSSGSKCFLLEYSKKDYNELQDNFAKLLQIKELINEGDEIYLDITDGFRYIPILNMLLVQFLLVYKNHSFKVAAIYHAMLSSPVSEVINLKEFFDLIEWANAINAFKKHLNADSLIDMMDNGEVDSEVKNVFIQINSNFQLVNLGALWQFFKNAKSKIEHIKSAELPLLPFLHEDLVKLVDRLSVDSPSQFQFEIAKWFYENHQYALSYLVLHEAIVTRFCEIKFPGKNSENKRIRNEVRMNRIDPPYDKHFLENRGTPKKNLDSIATIRNSIANQFNNRKDKVNQDIDRLKKFIEFYQPLFIIDKNSQ